MGKDRSCNPLWAGVGGNDGQVQVGKCIKYFTSRLLKISTIFMGQNIVEWGEDNIIDLAYNTPRAFWGQLVVILSWCEWLHRFQA